MEYGVCESGNLQELTDKVNDHIAKGWTPLGGISVNYIEYEDKWQPLYTQAMVILGKHYGWSELDSQAVPLTEDVKHATTAG